ncbi:mixed-linked glucanase [Colletotrichum abscissum]|uniref:Mixed-linked glucanase n=1 Tax=Colletotrichum abscissum TaxID=1671311 RepID=A0A9P9XNX4_9PEZI|nr:mixed-linked glucanase [Colletotrichum abscissum]KAI3557023.1 mixed-linked glucanase [Colletotrichum abscissum]KAK1499863.1 mixed-linked glucanase [Colletotrichum abscissum]
MAPSLLSTLSSALLLTSSAAAVQTYQLADSYDSTNFLEKFGFFTSDHSTGNYNDVDPTGGYVSYKSAADAQSIGLVKTEGGDLYLGVDSTSTLDAAGTGRSSVRIESTAKYGQGLFVINFSHLPKPVCGAWPAVWTVGNPWPAAGEIDIVETWNEDNVNKVVLHTDGTLGECRIDGTNMTGTISKPNCANYAAGQSDNEGCAGLDGAAPFGSAEGGVYAMQWTNTAIRVWGFTHANVPADIASANPNPDAWGTPSFTTSTCAADKLFEEQKLVANIDFCGVAGNDGIWTQTCEAKTGMTCKEYVAANPTAFADVFFKISSIKYYNLKDGNATASVISSSVAASTVAASTSVAQTAVVSSALSTAVASEKPVATSAAAVESLTTRLATSTVYATNIKTITSCAAEVTNCPARETPQVVTEVVAVTTTVCPVVDVPTQLTVIKTEVHTITSCAPEVTNCPARQTTVTSQAVIPTTVAIPVESYIPSKPAGGDAPITVSSQEPVADITTAITTYETNIITITSCAAEVTNCPVRTSTVVTSKVIPTTIPGVPAVPTTAGSAKPVVTGQPPAEQITTYLTNVVTITSCAAEVTNCPARTSTIITSAVVPKPTTEASQKPVLTTDVPTVLTTYKTNLVTITSCAAEVTNCPARTSTIVTSELISTTVPKPVTNPVVGGTAVSEKPVPATSGASTAPGAGVPTVGVPASSSTVSTEKPVLETPGASGTPGGPPPIPTTLVVAPSDGYNGTLTTAVIPVGTGSTSPCVGAACPATTTGPVQAGAGKLSSGGLLAAVAALAVLVI